MVSDRSTARFKDFGRVEAPAISPFPGVMEDISSKGCKIRFPVSIEVDTETDYEIKVYPSRKATEAPIVLLCHPQWQQTVDGATEVGFSTLRSPDTLRLNNYIQQLTQEKACTDPDASLVSDSPLCQFV